MTQIVAIGHSSSMGCVSQQMLLFWEMTMLASGTNQRVGLKLITSCCFQTCKLQSLSAHAVRHSSSAIKGYTKRLIVNHILTELLDDKIQSTRPLYINNEANLTVRWL